MDEEDWDQVLALHTQASAVVKAPENKVLALTMSANPTTYSQAGQQIALEYVLTNTGNVPLGPGTFLVTDSHIALPITCGVPNTTIPPNTQVKCNATYLIAQGDVNAGSVVFTASRLKRLVGRRMHPKPRTDACQSNFPNLRYCPACPKSSRNPPTVAKP